MTMKSRLPLSEAEAVGLESRDSNPRLLLEFAAAPITVWDLLLDGVTSKFRGLAAAPTVAVLDLAKGRLTSFPLAAAPIDKKIIIGVKLSVIIIS